MSKFKVGDRVALSKSGIWSRPTTLKYAENGTVGEVVEVASSGSRATIKFPGGIEENISTRYLEAASVRDIRTETMAFLNGQKAALESRRDLALEEAAGASKRAAELTQSIEEIDAMIDTLKVPTEPKLKPGMSVVIDDPRTGSHGRVRTVLAVNPDGTFATPEFPKAHYNGWRLA